MGKVEIGTDTELVKGLSDDQIEEYRDRVKSGNPPNPFVEKDRPLYTKREENKNKRTVHNPNVDLLIDAFQNEESLLALAKKFKDTEANIITEIRNGLKWLAVRYNNLFESRYMVDFDMMVKYKDHWNILISKDVREVEYSSLPIHQKFIEHFKSLSMEAQKKFLSNLENIHHDMYEDS